MRTSCGLLSRGPTIGRTPFQTGEGSAPVGLSANAPAEHRLVWRHRVRADYPLCHEARSGAADHDRTRAADRSQARDTATRCAP